MAGIVAIRAAASAETEKGAGSPRPDRTRPAQERAARAVYIAEMSTELAKLARDAEMPMLAYFLELARVEAETHARRDGGTEIRRGE